MIDPDPFIATAVRVDAATGVLRGPLLPNASMRVEPWSVVGDREDCCKNENREYAHR